MKGLRYRVLDCLGNEQARFRYHGEAQEWAESEAMGSPGLVRYVIPLTVREVSVWGIYRFKSGEGLTLISLKDFRAQIRRMKKLDQELTAKGVTS